VALNSLVVLWIGQLSLVDCGPHIVNWMEVYGTKKIKTKGF
jgi:hypothetical protein